MKNSKIIEVLIFISGLGLSLITNLITGDPEVVGYYESNKNYVLLAGIGLTLLGIYLAFRSQSKEDEGKSGVSSFKFLTAVLSSGLICLVSGVISGVVVLWVVEYFEFSILPSVQIVSIVIGLGIGTRFRFIYGNDISGAILGGVIGYAVSFYFLPGFDVTGLPSWLSNPPVMSSGIIAGLIGLFTAIFEDDFKKAAKEEREKVKKEEEKKKQQLEPQLELFDLAVAILKTKGFEVYTGKMADRLWSTFEKMLANESKKESLESPGDDPKAVRQYMNEIKNELDANPQIAFWKAIIQSGNDKEKKLPEPPYAVFNENGEEIQKFTSISALHKFAESI